jgi:hypothetical protein
VNQHVKERNSSSNIAIQASALMAHYAPSLCLCDANTVSLLPRQHQRRRGPTTMAQRMGLVTGPAPPLSEDEWANAHAQSQKRADSFHPCAICQEPFRNTPQVLLSCSHVFHKDCITSFEKFSQSKQCPLCRRQEYQKRLIADGKHALLHLSAVKIQCCWRYYVARKKRFYLLMDKDPALKRAYHFGIVRGVSDRYLAVSEQNCRNVDRFLESLDQERARVRLLFMTEADWTEAEIKASLREPSDCPICMQPLKAAFTSACSLPEISTNKRMECEPHISKEVLLLSCSHCFHSKCLHTFEQFQLVQHHSSSSISSATTTASSEGYNAPPPTRCPVCRSEYVQRILCRCKIDKT